MQDVALEERRNSHLDNHFAWLAYHLDPKLRDALDESERIASDVLQYLKDHRTLDDSG